MFRAQFESLEAPANQITLFQVEGAVNEHDEDDGAVGNRDAAFACVVQAMSPDSESAEANRRWVRSAWESLKRFSTGGNYVNFQTADESAERVTDTYRTNLERLARIKATYGPDNLFRVNRKHHSGQLAVSATARLSARAVHGRARTRSGLTLG